MIDADGIETSWKREVNCAEDVDLYVIGRRVELTYVLQRARMNLSDLGLDQTEKWILTLRIDLPRSQTYCSGNGTRSWAAQAARSGAGIRRRRGQAPHHAREEGKEGQGRQTLTRCSDRASV